MFPSSRLRTIFYSSKTRVACDDVASLSTHLPHPAERSAACEEACASPKARSHGGVSRAPPGQQMRLRQVGVHCANGHTAVESRCGILRFRGGDCGHHRSMRATRARANLMRRSRRMFLMFRPSPAANPLERAHYLTRLRFAEGGQALAVSWTRKVNETRRRHASPAFPLTAGISWVRRR